MISMPMWHSVIYVVSMCSSVIQFKTCIQNLISKQHTYIDKIIYQTLTTAVFQSLITRSVVYMAEGSTESLVFNGTSLSSLIFWVRTLLFWKLYEFFLWVQYFLCHLNWLWLLVFLKKVVMQRQQSINHSVVKVEHLTPRIQLCYIFA